MSSSKNIENVFDRFAEQLKQMMIKEFDWYNYSVEKKFDAFVAEFKSTLPKKQQSEYHIFIKKKIAEYKSQGLSGNLLEMAREEWKKCKNTKTDTNDINKLINKILNAKTDYDILGISNNTSSIEIKKAYKSLSLLVHPDKCKHPNATQAFQRVNIAYHKLMGL